MQGISRSLSARWARASSGWGGAGACSRRLAGARLGFWWSRKTGMTCPSWSNRSSAASPAPQPRGPAPATNPYPSSWAFRRAPRRRCSAPGMPPLMSTPPRPTRASNPCSPRLRCRLAKVCGAVPWSQNCGLKTTSSTTPPTKTTYNSSAGHGLPGADQDSWRDGVLVASVDLIPTKPSAGAGGHQRPAAGPSGGAHDEETWKFSPHGDHVDERDKTSTSTSSSTTNTSAAPRVLPNPRITIGVAALTVWATGSAPAGSTNLASCLAAGAFAMLASGTSAGRLDGQGPVPGRSGRAEARICPDVIIRLPKGVNFDSAEVCATAASPMAPASGCATKNRGLWLG